MLLLLFLEASLSPVFRAVLPSQVAEVLAGRRMWSRIDSSLWSQADAESDSAMDINGAHLHVRDDDGRVAAALRLTPKRATRWVQEPRYDLFALATKFGCSVDEVALIDRGWAHPLFRRQGLIRSLVFAAFDSARTDGHSVALSVTEDDNRGGVGVLADAGFQPVRRVALAPGRRFTIWGRSLGDRRPDADNVR